MRDGKDVAGTTDTATASTSREDAQHTPGPWSWFSKRVAGAYVQERDGMKFLYGADGQGFAHTVGLSGITDEANARLIAAAPELLAALKALIEACEWYAEDTYDREAPHQLHAFSEAKRAIVKADGK